jgi:para-nitrobenzyl esterase
LLITNRRQETTLCVKYQLKPITCEAARVKSNNAPDSFVRSLLPVALAAVTLLYLLPAAGARSADGDLVVRTTSGRVRGIIRRGSGAEFLGIPFARPPIGVLRWREPQPVEAWKGVRDASAFGAPCAQAVLGDWNRRDAETGKEDCLFLNVITPEWRPKKPLPVMFWIHGGAARAKSARTNML